MRGCVFEISWTNPYTAPPNGKRILGRVIFHPSRDCFTRESMGNGYGPRFVEHLDAKPARPPRRWSKERRAARRRQNLRRRAERDAPLFADDIVRDAIAQRPEYFDGEYPGEE